MIHENENEDEKLKDEKFHSYLYDFPPSDYYFDHHSIVPPRHRPHHHHSLRDVTAKTWVVLGFAFVIMLIVGIIYLYNQRNKLMRQMQQYNEPPPDDF